MDTVTAFTVQKNTELDKPPRAAANAWRKVQTKESENYGLYMDKIGTVDWSSRDTAKWRRDPPCLIIMCVLETADLTIQF